MKTPWQYEWKRPKLEALQKNKDEATPWCGEGAMDVTAAMVAPDEVSASTNSDALLLTVTLLGDGKKQGMGTRFALKLVEPPPSSTVLEARELQWPGSMFGDEGVISIELCRKSSEQAVSSTAVDALEVVNLMSLGIMDLPAESMDVSISSKERFSSESATAVPDTEKSNHLGEIKAPPKRSELILVCLTSNGRVHLYKALNLLLKEKPAAEDGSVTPPDGMEIGFASMLMGNSLFQQVQQSLFPLSTPYATVSLSVPLQQKKEPREEGLIFQFPFFNANSSRRKEGVDIPLFDASFWDATVERSTATHRTLHNRPEHIVSIFQSHIAVIGRGTRTRKVRNKKVNEAMVVVEGIEALDDIEQDNQMVFGGVEEQKEDPGDWWKKEEQGAAGQDIQQDEEPWWKKLDSGDEDDTIVEQEETGGFITFIDLYHSSETRTLYLPFAPKSVHPLFWDDMSFVIVLADESASPDHSAKAVAIRVDSSSKTYFDCGESPTAPAMEELEMISADGKIVKKPLCEVRRFTLLPIILPIDDQLSSTTIRTSTVSSLQSSPPSIELLYSSRSLDEDKYDVALTLNTLHYFDLVRPSDLPSYPHYAKAGNSIAVVRTIQRVGHTARIPHQLDEQALEACWSRIFQGCSVFRTKKSSYFVCWDGATEERGSFVRELDSVQDTETSNLNCVVLPLDPGKRTLSNLDGDFYGSANLQLPFSSASDIPESRVDSSGKAMDGIVVAALDSISSLNYRGAESLLSPASSPRLRRSQRLSNVEKSQRLVQHCGSWATLRDTKENRALFEAQTPVLLFIVEKEAQTFSLRHRFVENGDAAPFQQVLGWLSQSEDFFTAASIALGLLRDAESWSDLRRLKESTSTIEDFDDERESLEGLLDGIVPLYPEGRPTFQPSASVVTQVADMTIGCLAKGGLKMSKTLDGFLKRNLEYDPARAGLMLVAVATRCVSREKETVDIAMGPGYKYSERSKPDELLWALRSLLCVATSRDHLSQAIVLINAAMSDELRCRKPAKGLSSSTPPMELCKAIVTAIVAASEDAAGLLLDLVDEESRKRYWGSLSREGQLDFSLIDVEDKYPLLEQAEVRKWSLKCLDECVTQEESPSAVDLLDLMPTTWLQRLCEGCLANGECDYDRVLTYGIDNSEPDEDGGTSKCVAELQRAREALTATSKGGGVDFDLLIPALLILEQREALWNENATVSNQQILDAACDMAGRPGPISFPFDASKVMQQCAAASNVSAAANVVGGKNGFVLKCCDILIQHAALDMVAAESFILSDGLSENLEPSRAQTKVNDFVLTDGHRQVLWLLLEHVLNVRTFGEFHPSHMRGKVDPVFAAQACLRTWARLSISTGATTWLVNWLRRKLEMENGQISPKRLACAALTRVLMWPTSDESPELLAPIMNIESTFLVQLAQSCHGLMESLPLATAEAIIEKTARKAPAGADFPSVRV